jgi:thiol-disulfide isomerase/thioredoxin
MSTPKLNLPSAVKTWGHVKRWVMIGSALVLVANAARAAEVSQTLPFLDIAEIRQSKGQFIYIDFWASWCAPCRQSFPWMNALHSKYGARGLKVVAINVDAKRTEADKFLAHTPAQFAVSFDAHGESAKVLAIKTMPTSVLVHPDGRVLWVHSGFRKEDGPELEARIAKALVAQQRLDRH